MTLNEKYREFMVSQGFITDDHIRMGVTHGHSAFMAGACAMAELFCVTGGPIIGELHGIREELEKIYHRYVSATL